MRNISENYGRVNLALSFQDNLPYCVGWLSLPADNVWPQWLRILLYVLGLLYIFVGIAVISDIFMFSIERITAEKRIIRVYDQATGAHIECSVFIWNETVANLTLMALGSSAPEILLACIEALKTILSPPKEPPDSLGLFTILGSAAFNLFVISGLCILSIPSPQSKRIEKFGVFIFTSFCSVFAYAWMLLITVFISPTVIELWEAVLTFLFFPMMVLIAYSIDKRFWTGNCCPERQLNQSESPLAETEQSGDFKSKHSNQDGQGDADQSNLSTSAMESHPSLVERRSRNLGSITSGEITFGHRLHIRPSLFRKCMFRYMTTKSLSRVNQCSRRLSNETGNIGSGKQHCGWAYFSSPIYSISPGTREVSCLVHLQRHFGIPEPALETVNEHSDRGNNETNANAMEPVTTTTDAQNHIGQTNHLNTHRTSASKLSTTSTSEVFYVPFEVRPGSAQPGIHYEPISSGLLRFTSEEAEQSIIIELNTDNSSPESFEPLDFYVVLTNHHAYDSKKRKSIDDREDDSEQNSQHRLRIATPGTPSIARVLLLASDAIDCIEMQASHYYATADVSAVVVTVLRRGPCQHACQVEIFTREGTAKAKENNTEDGEYLSLKKDIEFQPGVCSHVVSVQLTSTKLNGKYFFTELRNPRGNCKLGEHKVAICYLSLVESTEDAPDLTENDINWSDQFRMAVTLIPNVDENGIQVPLTNTDYAIHTLTFFWKLLSAFLPPRKYLGGYPTFILSLAFIGILTAIVEELSHMLGCVAALETAVTGITLVAIGTSLPDAFASRTAARLDETADNSIGNITGSNSVNVFLGLGLPWLISAIAAAIKGKQFCVSTSGVFEASVLFLGMAVICLANLLCRRLIFSGELGGPVCSKSLAGFGSISLWFTYVLILSLRAYGVIQWNTNLPLSSCSNAEN